ncbi:N-acetylmuramic acid 6-phosphate etherase [Arsukibacterium indicum]|uniref:N-acetylmuramic acid 6-phosphate etherase n=1 Tax=Arsukibacterium indicum TaxID=2848612 RepID=A0ABS6MPN0_9GAMM|nr:N-acetylmuramic acid 6-phosphate etherase [Arsukibacterium indicum]MBV2130530.1 N-acetylmuramic acid 6-phosphate etherase [Arsukibacterium indicum]
MSQSELLQQLAGMSTEARNPASAKLDQLNSLAIVSLINQADHTVAAAITPCLPAVARAVDTIVQAFACGGRLIYLGAGTSGRLGILDAAECPPTFSVPANQVIGLIAGGTTAIQQAVEGAEDSPELAVEELTGINFGPDDVLVGIAASGRTPYVLGGLAYGRKLGATTVAISCNSSGPILAAADIAICAEVGPEVLTGSTRMKAGTAQKMLLNMLSTAAMVRSGKVYQNLMVDLHASNQKLEARAVRIVMQATDCDSVTANAALLQASMNAKLAILLILTGQDLASCQQALAASNGFVSKALEAAK